VLSAVKSNHEGAKTRRYTKVLEDLATELVDCGLQVHRALGPGLLESIYEECLFRELEYREIPCRRQVAIPITYRGARVEGAYRIDLIVADAIIVELKAVEVLTQVHHAQLLTYLKLSGYEIGFLMNFNVALFKSGIKRFIR
jgi:GxxExxY protein